MKCRKCNFELPPGEKECPLCGTDCAYVEKKHAQKNRKKRAKMRAQAVPRKKSAIDDQACATVYLDSEEKAIFTCPQCNKLKLLDFSPKEFELLAFMVKNRGIALTRDQLLEEVWGYDSEVDTRTVDVHIRWLREKIENDPGKPRHLLTVRGIGYRFEG